MKKNAAKSSSTAKKSPMERCISDKTLHLAESVFLGLGTPVALNLLSLCLHGKLADVVDYRIDPHSYSSAGSFRSDYLAASLLSKCPLEVGVDRDAVAATNFAAAEASCAATNKRLSAPIGGSVRNAVTPASIMFMARKKIEGWLGPFSWDEAESSFGFGPGASIPVKHRFGDVYYKFRAQPCATPGCADLAYAAVRRVPRWFQHACHLVGETPETIASLPYPDQVRRIVKIVPGNRVTFVPKDAKKSRSIAIEPTMNGYIQHGIGRMIRRRLKHVRCSRRSDYRIDLDDQTRNQHLAHFSSVHGGLATLDLSAASDSVSMKLVEQLLPVDWFDAICRTRSPVGSLPSGDVISYQKVSSMGNGYTFELESLIFLALCRACVDVLHLDGASFAEHGDLVSVYGDDLVVPIAAVPTVRWMLEFCGFGLNAEKSFWTGPFRESCGKHYFQGEDVTPFYVRKPVDTVHRLFWFANQCKRWSASACWGLDPDLHPTYDLAVSFLPFSLRRPSIPEGIGDMALIGDFDEVLPRLNVEKTSDYQTTVYQADAWVPLEKTREFCDYLFLLRQIAPMEIGASHPHPHCVDERGLVDPRLIPWAALPDWLVKKGMRFADHSYRPLDGRCAPRWRRIKVLVTTKWPCLGPWLDAIT